MESFFLNLKMERVWQRDYANHAEATNDIADYIVSFYNSQRLHSKLGNLPPNAFEQKSAIKQPIGLCEKTSASTIRIKSAPATTFWRLQICQLYALPYSGKLA